MFVILTNPLVMQETACSAGDVGLIPGLGISPGGGHGNPLQDSGLENPHGQRSPWGRKRVGHDRGTKQQQDEK